MPCGVGLGALSQEECGHKGGECSAEQTTKEEAEEQEQAVSAGASSRLALPGPCGPSGVTEPAGPRQLSC